MRQLLIHFARRISRYEFVKKIIRWMIVNLSSLFLGDKIYQTDHLFVVKHPKPAYPVHCLILPKQQIKDLTDQKVDPLFWNDIPGAVNSLVEKFCPDETGYRIIANGGEYQEIPVLHVHFVSGENHG